MPCWYAAVLLNESHLVNFLYRGDARANLCQPAFAQSDHALFASDALDLRSRPAIHDHFPDAVGQVEQLANGRAAMITGARAFQAPGTLGECDVAPDNRIDAGLLQFLGRIFFWPLAIRTDHANEPLRHDAVQRGDKVIRLDAHVDEAADDVGNVVGVDGGENEVAGECGLDGDLGGFLIADFANHDLVRVMSQDGAQAARKGETLFLVHRNLRDAAQLILDRIFDGDDFVLVGLDLVDSRVERGGLSGTRGTRHQDHAVGLSNVAPEAAGFFRREEANGHRQAPVIFRNRFLFHSAWR